MKLIYKLFFSTVIAMATVLWAMPSDAKTTVIRGNIVSMKAHSFNWNDGTDVSVVNNSRYRVNTWIPFLSTRTEVLYPGEYLTFHSDFDYQGLVVAFAYSDAYGVFAESSRYVPNEGTLYIYDPAYISNTADKSHVMMNAVVK